MKLPLLAVLAFLPCVALAQSTTDSDSGSTSSTNPPACSGSGHGKGKHHFSPQQQLARLTTKLGLSDTQQGQIGPVLVSRDAQLKAIFQNTSLSKEQKHEQAKAVFQASKQQIESFLTPEQVTQFEALHQKHGKRSA